MNYISTIILPVVVLIVIYYGLKKKVNIYDSFTNGAKEGLVTTFKIFPTMIAMVFAVNIFLKSGFIEFVFSFFKNPYVSKIISMAFLRPISGSATLVILNDILKTFGPDNIVGKIASVMQGCTDTTFYVITLYFGSVGIKKIRHALFSGLFADLIGIVSSILIVYLFFS